MLIQLDNGTIINMDHVLEWKPLGNGRAKLRVVNSTYMNIEDVTDDDMKRIRMAATTAVYIPVRHEDEAQIIEDLRSDPRATLKPLPGDPGVTGYTEDSTITGTQTATEALRAKAKSLSLKPHWNAKPSTILKMIENAEREMESVAG